MSRKTWDLRLPPDVSVEEPKYFLDVLNRRLAAIEEGLRSAGIGIAGLEESALALPTQNGQAGKLLGTTGLGLEWRAAVRDNAHVVSGSASDLSLTTSYVDVTGAAVTLTQAGVWLVSATLNFAQDPVDGALMAQLLVDGVADPDVLVLSGTVQATLGRAWIVTADAGDVAKLQAKKVSGAGSSSVVGAYTRVSAAWLHP